PSEVLGFLSEIAPWARAWAYGDLAVMELVFEKVVVVFINWLARVNVSVLELISARVYGRMAQLVIVI
ncbi:hypothetical protein JS569_27385, partial [Klebsiella pneumoniae]|uniref:hypothetical protein n=1 Tax=Klebsiella pneumoniae TaxID=573 RepID=UPI00194E6D8D